MSAQPYPDVRATLGITDDQGTATSKASIAPTKQELEAIVLLKDQDAAIVCAYLRVVRALGGSSDLSNGQSVLTKDEMHAIFALSGHEDAIVWSWLANAQGAFERNHFESIPSRVGIAHDLTHVENELQTSIHLSAGFPGALANQSTDIPPLKTYRQPTAPCRSHHNPSDDTVLANAERVSRPYSCTICGSQRSYQNPSDWKKHEKEHEATYVCMAGSSQEAPQNNENIEPHRACNFSCKRRDHMVTHLNRRHEIYNVAQARISADRWRCTTGKMFWSCGFCVRLFTTFAERLKHIGSEHYEQNQTYDEWDTTKLIRGLLLQPGVQRAWDAILATGPIHRFEEFVWDRRTIEETQYLLEMGPSPTQSAESLAMAAYKAGKLKTESPQSASALSISSAPSEAVEIDEGNASIMLHSPVSRRPNIERIPAHVASNNTSVANASPACWTASTSHVSDGSYMQSKSSEREVHMPNGTPSSEYDDWLGVGFESCSAPESPPSYATQTFII
ncbi:hypothetical protein JMJ35_010221 [Cladonia borealis]|uniref:C2H2-type domain-containing protein n=1 Tax=Cladonia borealis TaxID=184061 RepID=A0AA39QQB9_9LECA|nr:hypothetical protein JMJ35_010221 [Cladonia borealis]